MSSIRDYGPIRCGAVAHVWEDYQPLGRAPLGAVVQFRCANPDCGKIRTDVVSRATGKLISRHYSKTEQPGYRKLGYDKDDMRREFVRRFGKSKPRRIQFQVAGKRR